MELGERCLAALDEAALLPRALRGAAVQAHLGGVGGDDLVPLHGPVRLRADRTSGLGLAGPAVCPADARIAGAGLTQLGEAGVGGAAAVQDPAGADWGPPRLEPAGQRPGLAGLAGVQLRAADAAAGVQQQP